MAQPGPEVHPKSKAALFIREGERTEVNKEDSVRTRLEIKVAKV